MIDGPLAARREMASMIAAAWPVTDWASLSIAAAPAIIFEGREDSSPPSNEQPYVAFFVKHALGYQDSLSGENGQRKWGRDGVLTIQCFGSLSGGRGIEDASNIAMVAQRIYQGKSSDGCIWFRNVTTREVGPDPRGWYQMNMTAVFTYDEVA